jgi:predicted RNase H-like HicB family nuclease
VAILVEDHGLASTLAHATQPFQIARRYLESGIHMHLTINLDCEIDGRCIAEVPELPGVLVYGSTRDQAVSRAKALALRVLADRLENGEAVPELTQIFESPA